MKDPLQITEILLFFSIFVALLSFILLIFQIPISKKIFQKKSLLKKPKEVQKEKVSIVEIFDYLGTKIMQEKGKYIVNEKGSVTTYPSWEMLPHKFQKMVKELDHRSDPKANKDADGFFMEVINGIYYVTMPNGRKKRYNSLKDIPVRIRKLIGK